MFPSMVSSAVVRFRIDGFPRDTEYNRLPFGRQIEFRKRLADWKRSAKSVHVSIKRRSFAKALKESLTLYGVREYWCSVNDSPNYRDDSFELFYTV